MMPVGQISGHYLNLLAIYMVILAKKKDSHISGLKRFLLYCVIIKKGAVFPLHMARFKLSLPIFKEKNCIKNMLYWRILSGIHRCSKSVTL